MRHAAADDADHHRLDHGQREQRRDRGIDGVAAGREHLGARARGQRMIADHHAAAAGRRLLLTLKKPVAARSRQLTRQCCFSAFLLSLVSGISRRRCTARPMFRPDEPQFHDPASLQAELIPDDRDPLTFGSGWARSGRAAYTRRRQNAAQARRRHALTA